MFGYANGAVEFSVLPSEDSNCLERDGVMVVICSESKCGYNFRIAWILPDKLSELKSPAEWAGLPAHSIRSNLEDTS